MPKTINDTWNSSNKGSNIILSNSQKSATHSWSYPKHGWNSVYGNTAVSSGIQTWEVTMTSFDARAGNFWEFIIGVAYNTTKSTIFFTSEAASGAGQGYAYIAEGGEKVNGDQSTPYGDPYGAGDIIKIELNMNTGNLTFYKNNISQGVAYTVDTNKTYYLAASIGNGDTAVVLNHTNTAADICFPAGTPVTTDQGPIAIEKLIPGTHTIKEKPIVGISQTKSSDNHLLCFEKHALGHNIPDQQTIVSREHCILYKGKMKRACTFMRYTRIRKIKYTGETLYNVVLEKHGSMSVNNMTVETLHPKHWVAKKILSSTFSKS